MISRLLLLVPLLVSFNTFAQTNILKGRVVDQQSAGISGAHIIYDGLPRAVSDSLGYFNLENVEVNKQLVINHISYDTLIYTIISSDFDSELLLRLSLRTEVLEEVTIANRSQSTNAGLTIIKPIGLNAVTSPFGDLTSVLSTLPGVAVNSELSTVYRVRGGNFDENLVYVNDIPIYRPQLINSGEQEGLSFVHTDMVSEVAFSSGGWVARYGDKLSSVLNVSYKNPTQREGRIVGGLLGGSLYFGLGDPSKRTSMIAGIRHKNARYLFNTFDTQGEYLPKFTDVQALVRHQFQEDKLNMISILLSVANNNYEVIPETRETEFGAFGGGSFRFLVGFDGRQLMDYSTTQGGIKWEYDINDKVSNKLILSGVYSRERDFSDLESGYRLCDVDNNIGSQSFNECVVTRGLGTEYDYSRNSLDVKQLHFENRQSISINGQNEFEWGAIYSNKKIESQFNEYEFLDSADFVQVTEQILSSENIWVNGFEFYAQNQTRLNEKHFINLGARLNYQNLNNNWLISPRISYAFYPDWRRDISFRFATGLYSQNPFLRELISQQGKFNRDIKPQSSLHIILGMDYNFSWWGRPFKFIAESYYKYLWNVNPYDVDNVRVRYYANNQGEGKVYGIDFRLSGEFIPSTESWFTLSLLKAEENIEGDGNGFIRRPSDQRILMSIVFQDHLPNYPSLKVFLAFNFGSGFPFGPPNNLSLRNSFKGEEYRRVDIGLSKSFAFTSSKYLDEVAIRLEILNLLGTANTISYSWVQDFSGRSFGVPNNLSTRFLNLKLEANF